jgi:DNA-3-methyladenine glycosylase II
MLHTVQGSLPVRAPFDFTQSLAFLDMFGPTRGEQTLAPTSLTKALKLRGQVLAFRVSADRGRLSFTLYSERPISAELEREAAERIRFFLSADDEVEHFYALAKGDAPLRARVKELHGLHQVKFLTPIEIAVWAVLAQRCPRTLSRATKRRLVERYGGSIEVDGERHWAFPEARDLAAADPDELASLIKHERRTNYVRAVAAAFAAQDEQFLREAPYDEVEAWLRDIDGIGEWSSAFVLFRGLGRMERMPLSEPIQESARKVYGARFSMMQMRERCAHYGPWQGYWALYLRA